jgi:acetyl-CoA carboxylase biotin carboxyl carrier protein
LELDEIKSIIKLMQQNDLGLFELENEGFKIKLQRQAPAATPVLTTMSLPVQAQAAVAPASPVQAAASALEAPQAVDKTVYREILSPMVGTFYAAPSPESPAFVKIGQEIDDNTTVCIIEAMKVMNEIKAEMRGTVIEILVESGQPVQFGQPMLRVK